MRSRLRGRTLTAPSICACPAQSINRDVRVSFVVPHIRAIDYVQKLLRIVGIGMAPRGTGKPVLDEDQRPEAVLLPVLNNLWLSRDRKPRPRTPGGGKPLG